MPVKASSDVAKVEKFLLHPEVIRKELNRNSAAVSKTLIQDGFNKSQSPDEKKWKPIQDKGHEILQKTKKMKNSFDSKPTNQGFEITNSQEYTKYVQKKRPMVPENSNFSNKWNQALHESNSKIIDKMSKEAGAK
jgi:phage gpG-like protein